MLILKVYLKFIKILIEISKDFIFILKFCLVINFFNVDYVNIDLIQGY